jgi:heme/copper-type cytochrome/quinol oxidase subunit 2
MGTGEAGISRWRLVLWLGLGVAILGGVFCYSGFIMASSFMASNPEQIEHWRRLAHIYLALTGICAIIVFAIAVALYRSTFRRPPHAS